VTGYDHTVNLTYTLPLDKLPLTDWITSNVSYGAGYQWDRAPLLQDTLGHVIQNSQNIAINGQVNFVNLYNKIKYLKKINDKGKGAKPSAGRKPDKGEETEEEDKGKKPPDEPKIDPLAGFLRLLMMVRNGTITYSQNSGILLPGYNQPTNVLGMSPGFDAPGWGFVLGQQNHDFSGDLSRDFATYSADQDWLVQTPSIFTPYTNTRTETINGRLTVEPFKSMRVELLANRTISENHSSFFRWSDTRRHQPGRGDPLVLRGLYREERREGGAEPVQDPAHAQLGRHV
jgi:cell surface protein SprA